MKCCICGYIILADTDEWPNKLCAEHFDEFLVRFEKNKKWDPEVQRRIEELVTLAQDAHDWIVKHHPMPNYSDLVARLREATK